MRIEHIAIWIKDIEKMRNFYMSFFALDSNEIYHNPEKGFSSYFLAFENGARIELMHPPDINEFIERPDLKLGLTHFEISVCTKEKLYLLNEMIRDSGNSVIVEPRNTGDGYY